MCISVYFLKHTSDTTPAGTFVKSYTQSEQVTRTMSMATAVQQQDGYGDLATLNGESKSNLRIPITAAPQPA